MKKISFMALIAGLCFGLSAFGENDDSWADRNNADDEAENVAG